MKLKKILKTTAIISLVGLTAGLSTAIHYVEPIIAPEWYHEEWEKLQDCLQIRVKEPNYYVIKGENFPCINNPFKQCVGFHVPGYIFLAENYKDTPNVLRHEQIHALGIWNEDLVDRTLERCT